MAGADGALTPLGMVDQSTRTSNGELSAVATRDNGSTKSSTTIAQSDAAKASKPAQSPKHWLKSAFIVLNRTLHTQKFLKLGSAPSLPSIIGSNVLLKAKHRRLTPRDIEAASDVFNIPELLDLILSNLPSNDLFFRASRVCRGFKATIDSSPTIQQSINTASEVDLDTERLSRSIRYCLRHEALFPKTLRPGDSYTVDWVFDFRKGPTFEEHRASTSFRKLRIRVPFDSTWYAANNFCYKLICHTRSGDHVSGRRRSLRRATMRADVTFGEAFDQVALDGEDIRTIIKVEMWVWPVPPI